jgi:predicted GIY-YIG superfamily endonuclease
MGTVYLIHFDRPYHHARHYLGYTDDLAARLERHLAGNGGRLLQVIRAAGIGYRVVKTWEGDRTLERRLKDRKASPRLCPICKGEKQGCKR